tara:strand:- start:332 stop:730 length:399 start_codon:yes stop_codon:yes gene_type:complete
MDGIPAQIVEILGRTGMRGEATSVKVRVLDGDDRGRIIRRNVLGPIDIGDQLLLMDSSREAKALDREIEMVETKKCSFTGKPIPPGTGMMYVKKTGQVLYFINSKARKNYVNLGRVPARTRWTDVAAKKREQ